MAGELRYLGIDNSVFSHYGYKPSTHVFAYTGPVEAGDSQRLRKRLTQHLSNTNVFCETEMPAVIYLDSPGGNFSEGIKLAALFRQLGVGTIISPGAECLSACAVAFLGGTRHLCLDSDTGGYRRLMPGARLGFHAPRLLLPNRNYNNQQVTAAYDTAVKQVGQLVSEINKAGIPSSLIVEMLSKGVSEFYFIDTVGKAGRWKFDVAAKSARSPDRLQLTQACANASAWNNDSSEGGGDYSMTREGMTMDYWNRLYIEDRLGPTRRAFVQSEGMYAQACFVEMGQWPNTGRDRYWVKFFDESIQKVQQMYRQQNLSAAEAVLTPLHFYHPDTKLSELPVE